MRECTNARTQECGNAQTRLSHTSLHFCIRTFVHLCMFAFLAVKTHAQAASTLRLSILEAEERGAQSPRDLTMPG